MTAIVGRASVFNSSEAAYLISAFNATHNSTASFGYYRRCLKSKSDCSSWPSFDWPFLGRGFLRASVFSSGNLGLIPQQLRTRLDTFVKSLSVREVAYYDGWARRYPPRSSGLIMHFDDAWDELSVVVQLTAGAFLSVCPRRGLDCSETPGQDWILPIHLGAGEAIVYKGRDHAHGCRVLHFEEERWQMTLFYALPRYLGIVDYCNEGWAACVAEDLMQEDLPRLEQRVAKKEAKRMAQRGGAASGASAASAAHSHVRRDRTSMKSQGHTLTFRPELPVGHRKG